MMPQPRKAASSVELPNLLPWNLRPETCRARSISSSSAPQASYSRHCGSASPTRRSEASSSSTTSPSISSSSSTSSSSSSYSSSSITSSTTSSILAVPMNRVVVGTAPSPNLWSIQPKVGSLDNAHHRPGGGKVTTLGVIPATPV